MRLIDVDETIDALELTTWYHQSENGEMVKGANSQEHRAWYKAEDVYKVLNDLLSVQPEIIRCKDCVYCGSDVINAPYGITEKIWWCNKLCAGANENLIVEPDDFCSFAERREDDRFD